MDLKQAQYQLEMKEYKDKIETNKLQRDEISRQLEDEILKQNKSRSLTALGGVAEETWSSTM